MRKSGKKIEVLIGPSSFGEQDPLPLHLLKENGFKAIPNPYKRKLTKEEVMRLLSNNVPGLIAGLELLDREVLSNTALKVISRCGSGLSNIDLEAAREFEIKVCSTPDGPTLAVAELTIGMILNLLRSIAQMDNDLHQGKWHKRTGFQLKNKNVAIIGFGRIGQKVASLLQPFHVRIIAVDPFIQKSFPSVKFLSLSAALKKADIVIFHCSGSGEILGKKQFSMMKKRVLLLNASRGGVVNEDALCWALDNGVVSGAWLDTFVNEPYTGRLGDYPQVILTPHIGSYTLEGRRQMEIDAVKNFIAAFKKSGRR